MASDQSSIPDPAAAEPGSDQPLTMNLQILMPPSQATRPLLFSNLPVATTVRQLKERIRQIFPQRPSLENQRLIYRGHPLHRDQETLLEVFGGETLRTTDQQTIHLVIRDFEGHVSSASTTPIRGQSPAPGGSTGHETHAAQHSRHGHFGPQQSPSGFPRRHMETHLGPNPFPNFPGMPAARGAGPMTPIQLQQMQNAQHQAMSQWMNQLQREATSRAIHQAQRDRVAMGMQGLGNGSGANTPDHMRGRVSPGFQTETHSTTTTTTVREGITPTGQHFRVTVSENQFPWNSSPGPSGTTAPGQLSAAEVQNILRGADAGQATLAMTSAMQRSASGASLSGGPSPQGVGVTTPFYPVPMPGSRAGSRTTTPDPAIRTPSGGSSAASNARSAASQSAPEVYILQSPQGPRALLINNASETYYTPSVRMTTLGMPNTVARNLLRQRVPWTPTPDAGSSTPGPRLVPTPTQPEPEPQRPAQPAAANEAPIAAHPINPGIGPLVAQLWPHFWLLIRLGAFIWWFSNPNSSWWRWSLVLLLAAGIFVFNAGWLNGIADQAWVPIRRHMENLIPPLADPNQMRNQGPPQAQRQGGGNDAPPAADNRAPNRNAPNPVDTAARLIAERRNANANWLMEQVRRVERAGFLFLASIAPGVAERHIENLRAEQQRQRREQEAAEAAAAAAAAAAAQTAASAGEEGAEQPGADQGEAQQPAQGQGNEPPREEPLIAL